MVDRFLKVKESNSFFLFGARATGKSTFLKSFMNNKKCIFFDFLDPNLEENFSKNPQHFKEQILAQKDRIEWVVLDEIQRVPKLLNYVHQLIENENIKFAITGSSARKLKRGQANLLAGRALWHDFYPLSALELKESFCLEKALAFGCLPQIWNYNDQDIQTDYLKSYVVSYIQEEIKSEQLVRNLDPFRKFIEVAAQSDTQIINYSNFQRDTGVDIKTIQNYFSILNETLLCFFLEAHSSSVRKSIKKSPKFYFIDTGIQRALSEHLHIIPTRKTAYYGKLFESFIVNECYKLNKYYKKGFKFSYLKTKDDVEIDLIVERPHSRTLLIEIKSSTLIEDKKLNRFHSITKDFENTDAFCVCREKDERMHKGIKIMHWRVFLEKIFLS